MDDLLESSGMSDVIERTWITSQSAIGGSRKVSNMFTVMSWNILADGLAQTGGFVVDPSILTWEYRWPRILHEIQSVSPDVLCMMEANRFDDISIAFHDYVVLFSPKLASAALSPSCPSDGCMMLLRRNRFSPLQIKVLYLTDPMSGSLSNQNAILALVRDTQAEKVLLFVTSHLKAKSGELNAALRNSQAKEILSEISLFLSTQTDSDIPVFLCGDFNGSPQELLYSSILMSPITFQSIYNPLEAFECSDSIAPKSVQDAILRYSIGEPQFTTWKFREDGGEKKSTIDYMFLRSSARLECQSVYELPNEEDLSYRGLPSSNYPSDHLALACRLHWYVGEDAL